MYIVVKEGYSKLVTIIIVLFFNCFVLGNDETVNFFLK